MSQDSETRVELKRPLPPYMASTSALLCRAYPDGIPAHALPAVWHTLQPFMSYRNLAEVIAAYDHPMRSYAYHLNNAYGAAFPPSVPAETLSEVRARLADAGFEEWSQEL